jgi:hypothetical protein
VEIMLRLPGLLGSAALAAAVLTVPAAAALAAPAPAPASPAYSRAILSWAAAPMGRVVVRVGAGFDAAGFAAAVRAAGGRPVSIKKELGRVVVDLPGGADGQAAADVRAVPGVRGLSAKLRTAAPRN